MEIIEHFVLKGATIRQDLNRVLSRLSVSNSRSQLEVVTDGLVTEYLKQIDFRTVKNAERMSDFYQIFFVLENDIRDMVEETLAGQFGEDWWIKSVPQSVKENCQKNVDREASEGLPPRSNRLIEYTTFGEMSEIIKDNWDSFSGIFSNASKNRVLRVLARLNHARGPIAHCNLLVEEESVRLKLAIRDWFKLME